MKEHLPFRNQRNLKRKTEQHQIEVLYEDSHTHIKLLKINCSKKQHMMIEEPDFDRMEAISPVDEDDRKILLTQMHPRRRDEEKFYHRSDLMNCSDIMS